MLWLTRLSCALVVLLIGAFASDSAAGPDAKASVVFRASSTITSDENGPAQTNIGFTKMWILIDITELGVSQTLKIWMEILDPISAQWKVMEGSDAFSTVAVHTICVQTPPCSSSQMDAADIFEFDIPRIWRLRYDVLNGTNATFSVSLIPQP